MNISFLSIDDNKNNMGLFTPWSIVHIIVGTLLYKLLKLYNNQYNSIIWTIILHTIYEFKDLYFSYFHNTNFNIEKNKWLYYNSYINSIGDTIACIIGIYIAYLYKFNILTYIILIVSMILLVSLFTYVKYK